MEVMKGVAEGKRGEKRASKGGSVGESERDRHRKRKTDRTTMPSLVSSFFSQWSLLDLARERKRLSPISHLLYVLFEKRNTSSSENNCDLQQIHKFS